MPIARRWRCNRRAPGRFATWASAWASKRSSRNRPRATAGRVEIDHDELRAYHGLATALIKVGKADELLEFLEQAVGWNPDRAEVHHALGLARASLKEWPVAEQCHRRALELRPDFAEAVRDLGHTLIGQGRLDEAVDCYRRTLELSPNAAESWKNLGSGLTWQGKAEEALGCYEQALKLDPDCSECRFDLAATLLRLGDFERGWVEFEQSSEARLIIRQDPRPLWDGRPLRGRKILLIAEQGLGDTLQFIRYAALVRKRGGNVTVACQKPLLQILESCPGIDRLVALDSIPPDYDVFASLLNLPRIFGTTLIADSHPGPLCARAAGPGRILGARSCGPWDGFWLASPGKAIRSTATTATARFA